MILGIGRSQLMNDVFALQAFVAAVAKALSSKGGSISPSQINIINVNSNYIYYYSNSYPYHYYYYLYDT